MKTKIFLLLASLAMGTYLLNALDKSEIEYENELIARQIKENDAYQKWLTTNPKSAKEWEDASLELVQGAFPDTFKPESEELSKPGKYGTSLLTGFAHSYKMAIEPVVNTGKLLIDGLQSKIDAADAAGNILSSSGYKALQTALSLAVPTAAFVVSYPAIIAGIGYGLGSHLGLDIVDLFRQAKTKLMSNSLSSAEAAQLAQEINETAEELEEQIAILQKKLQLKRLQENT